MQFLKRCWSAFSKWWAADGLSGGLEQPAAAGASGSQAYVQAGGEVARFVFESRDLHADGAPKARAFRPDFHPELKRYEVSVCGRVGVALERLWHLGRTIRAAEGKAAIAALPLAVDRLTSSGFLCEAAPDLPDFPEHGVILGWDPDPDAKSARLDRQNELAALVSAAAVLRP